MVFLQLFSYVTPPKPSEKRASRISLVKNGYCLPEGMEPVGWSRAWGNSWEILTMSSEWRQNLCRTQWQEKTAVWLFYSSRICSGKDFEFSSELRGQLISYYLERSPMEDICQSKPPPVEWGWQSTTLSRSWERHCKSLAKEWISNTECHGSAKDPTAISREPQKFPEGEKQLFSVTWKAPWPGFFHTCQVESIALSTIMASLP